MCDAGSGISLNFVSISFVFLKGTTVQVMGHRCFQSVEGEIKRVHHTRVEKSKEKFARKKEEVRIEDTGYLASETGMRVPEKKTSLVQKSVEKETFQNHNIVLSVN